MDSWYGLIILFIIISIINSIFGKKNKKPGSPFPGQQRPPQRTEKDRDELIREMFGISPPKTPDMNTQRPANPRANNAGTWNPEDDYKNVTEAERKANAIPNIDYDTDIRTLPPAKRKGSYYQSQTGTVNTKNAGWRTEDDYDKVTAAERKAKAIPDIDYDTTASLELKPMEDFRKSLQRKQELIQKEIVHIKSLKEKIRHPETLKDYIIVSEILNKPVALRK